MFSKRKLDNGGDLMDTAIALWNSALPLEINSSYSSWVRVMENQEIKSKGSNILEYINLVEESSANRRLPLFVCKEKMLIYHSNAGILNRQIEKGLQTLRFCKFLSVMEVKLIHETTKARYC